METPAQRFTRLAEMAETARPVLRLESDDGGYLFLIAQPNEDGDLLLSHNNHHIVVPETVVDGFVKWLTDTFLTPTHKEEI